MSQVRRNLQSLQIGKNLSKIANVELTVRIRDQSHQIDRTTVAGAQRSQKLCPIIVDIRTDGHGYQKRMNLLLSALNRSKGCLTLISNEANLVDSSTYAAITIPYIRLHHAFEEDAHVIVDVSRATQTLTERVVEHLIKGSNRNRIYDEIDWNSVSDKTDLPKYACTAAPQTHLEDSRNNGGGLGHGARRSPMLCSPTRIVATPALLGGTPTARG